MAGHRKDVIFVQLLLFHIAVYPIMLIYFNPGISLIFIGILEFIFIFQVSYFFEHLLSYTIWIYVIHPDGHGLAKRLYIGSNGMGISTKWFFSFVSFHCDRFMNSTSQPLQNGSCDFATFFDISTKWFYPKNNIWHHMINISFLPLY